MSNGRQFALDVGKFVTKTRGIPDLILRSLLQDISKGLVERTPRDTGRLVGNWQFGQDSYPQNEVSVGGEGQGGAVANQTLQKLMQVSSTVHAGHIHYIVNNVPYAPVVEYGLYPNPPKNGGTTEGGRSKTSGGYSTQAPKGMVRITAVEFRTYIRKATRGLG